MTRRPLRPCLVCRRPSNGSRCPQHRLPPRGAEHARNAAIVRATAVTCALCGLPFTDPTDPPVGDHRIPRAQGGTDHISNYQAAHASCNGRKGSTLQGGMWR
jgi:5-methylcytosine-specific restriction endonuclease McrA